MNPPCEEVARRREPREIHAQEPRNAKPYPAPQTPFGMTDFLIGLNRADMGLALRASGKQCWTATKKKAKSYSEVAERIEARRTRGNCQSGHL